MKGIILAGGTGRRLDPLTRITNKHLLPVYKKPMIMYPLETMMQSGISEIVIVTSSEYIGHFYRLTGNGTEWGINIRYAIQEGNVGTGAALLCARGYVEDDDFMVILGDNIVSGTISSYIKDFEAERDEFDAKIFVASVKNPESYGVVEIDGNRIVKIIEKPENPFSNYVNTGLWIFKPDIFKLCEDLVLSQRDEYEITDVLNNYAQKGKLTYTLLDCEWADAGTFEELYRASNMMYYLEKNKMREV